MIERTTYICEICGKQYESNDEAIKCENTHRVEAIKDSVWLWSYNFNPIDITDFGAYEDAVYAYASDFESIEICNDLWENFLGLDSPFCNGNETGFYYFDDNDTWKSITQVRNRLDEIEEQLKY